jgi:uncharacterized protein
MPKAKHSPCIKWCTYDDEGYCLGCSRTANEVQGWRDRTEEQQLAGIKMLKERIYSRGKTKWMSKPVTTALEK